MTDTAQQEHGDFQRRIEDLRAFEREYRSRLRAYLLSSLVTLDPEVVVITRGSLITALQHEAVTGALEGLDSQGGTPADLADAILDALDETA